MSDIENFLKRFQVLEHAHFFRYTPSDWHPVISVRKSRKVEKLFLGIATGKVMAVSQIFPT